jgi:RNA polymerase sigma-70 factor, ECF subfamily
VGIQEEPESTDPVVAIYGQALPQVYGYLLPRCGNAAVAEDLTAETFTAAVDAARRRNAPEINVAWLVGVARHKLVDHWRRLAREQQTLAVAELPDQGVDDPWEDWIDTDAAHTALARLSADHRAALTLRYLDGLPVADVAFHMGRSLRATETLLARARAALRRIYLAGESHGK